MLRKILNKNSLSNAINFERQLQCFYCERRRRKGDGTKTDIFEERAAASQEEYFRKRTARQLDILREKLRKMNEEVKTTIEGVGSEKDKEKDK
ncbi:uncharacterized protein LOC111693598 [Trichogramma pretiosum]|uniref:uncharacterized protein LOC111693598 n=1 Tax=Trichogramma pretiosum TaxID=7493 RepID=UPI000C71BD23|nr:uncharacterized protein LOC111693598 [Trichogramma pretiosum]